MRITGFYDYNYQVTAFNECNNLVQISLLLPMFCQIHRKQKGQHVVDCFLQRERNAYKVHRSLSQKIVRKKYHKYPLVDKSTGKEPQKMTGWFCNAKHTEAYLAFQNLETNSTGQISIYNHCYEGL